MDSEIHSRKAEALCLLDGADYDLAAGEMIAFLIKLIEAVVAVRNLVKIVMEDQLCDETFNEYKDFINRIYENLATGNIRAAQNKIPEARQIGNRSIASMTATAIATSTAAARTRMRTLKCIK